MFTKSLAIAALFSLAAVTACTEASSDAQDNAICLEADTTQTDVAIDDVQDHVAAIIAAEQDHGAPGDGADAFGCCGADPGTTVTPTPLPSPLPGPTLFAPGNTCTDEWGKYSEAAGRYFQSRDLFGIPYLGLVKPWSYCAAVKTLLWDVRRAVGAWKDCCAAKGGATVAGCNAYTPGHVFPDNYPR